MPKIEIDVEVLTDLESRATGFNVTPNDVLRRILKLPPRTASQAKVAAGPARDFRGFLESDEFQNHRQSVDRFLVMLAWLHRKHPERFAEAAGGFQRGRRLYFAKSEQEILKSGENVTAKPIPDSPFWALTTLDNRSKRLVIEDMLQALGHPRSDIDLAVRALPDSGIRRGRDVALALRVLAGEKM